MGQSPPLLELRGVSRHFGGVKAVHNMALAVEAGEVVALIGPNGAGKSTLFHSISGLVQPDAGQVLWRGEDITRRPPEARVARGIACTFQNLRLFPDMSVRENVLTGSYHRIATGWPGLLRSLFRASRAMDAASERADELLDLVGLGGSSDVDVDSLSYGAKKRLELARALATGPELVLLDEPVAGMNPQEKSDIQGVLARLRTLGLTVFLVEHDMQFVMTLVDRVVVMNFGECIADGTPEAVQRNPEVQIAYLGSEWN